MKYLLLVLLLYGCTATQTCPTCPPIPVCEICPPAPKPVIDSILVPGPTVTLLSPIEYPVVPFTTFDTVGKVLLPSGGDDWPQMQAALNGGGILRLARNGRYSISAPLLVFNLVNGTYGQSWCDIEGPTSAMNAPTGQVATILPQFTNTFAIGLQQCKGCVIKNIAIQGQYTKCNGFNAIQVDTTQFAGWADGICSTNQTSPYSGICIDPFSDPKDFTGQDSMYAGLSAYYLPGMSQSGSTGIELSGLSITNFICGVMISPAFQENGELINLESSSIHNCRSAYCYSNAQQKANTVHILEAWSQIHTVFDGRYGAQRGDGATLPMVDVVNIAGEVKELMYGSTGTFPGTFNRIYAEGLWRLGTGGGTAGMSFTNCQIDFQTSQSGVPSPPYYWLGSAYFTDCMLRIYGPVPGKRIIMNWPNNDFDHCVFSAPPVVRILDFPFVDYPTSEFPASLATCTMYYSGAIMSGTGYDSTVSLGSAVIQVNPDYTGYVILPGAAPDSNDLLITSGYYPDLPTVFTDEYPIGYRDHINGDTVFLNHIGWGIQSGDTLSYVEDIKVKSEFP
jgi:hypothetical protein